MAAGVVASRKKVLPRVTSVRIRLAAELVICALITACAPERPSDAADPFGYEALRRELGDATPDGSGVAVQMIEASAPIMEEIDGVETRVGTGFAPNIGILEFSGKDIDVLPAIFARHSPHATGTARKFFGRATSTSPGITEVRAFESMTWLGSVLRLGRDRLPEPSVARVGNHSWVGSVDHPELPGTRNLQALRRIDWLVDTDDCIQVAGFNANEGSPLFASAHNVIAVSHVDGAYAAGSAPVDPGDYPRGRARPQLVVTEANPSGAAPRVSSAAALLIQAGHADASLSADPAGVVTRNRSGQTLLNAERSEVIKAALMAGAVPVESAEPAIARTANGLDARYGAGRLNIRNSYRVIAGGERNSSEDEPGGGGEIWGSGFDYDAAFGGAGERNAQATYFLATQSREAAFSATLVWNARVPIGEKLSFDVPARVVDMDLALYEVRVTGQWERVASSTSRTDNTESIRARLAPDTRYALRVEPAPEQRPFAWDYGLAWHLESDPDR